MRQPERLLTVEDIAEKLALSVRQIRRLDAAGKLPQPIRSLGRGKRWSESVIDEWIRQGCPDRKTFHLDL
jgi:excisionase family DNA binding protein